MSAIGNNLPPSTEQVSHGVVSADSTRVSEIARENLDWTTETMQEIPILRSCLKKSSLTENVMTESGFFAYGQVWLVLLRVKSIAQFNEENEASTKIIAPKDYTHQSAELKAREFCIGEVRESKKKD